MHSSRKGLGLSFGRSLRRSWARLVVSPRRPSDPAAMAAVRWAEAHFQWECPLRFLEVYGKSPPGFTQGSPTVKDPAAWVGSDITADTAKAWRDFLAEHPEVIKAHGVPWETCFD